MYWIIVGLGNPGEEYVRTRHNVGRMIVDAFRRHGDLPEWEQSSKAGALYTHGKLGKDTVELILPETFMNMSGKSVAYACSKHKVPSERLIVVQDDIDMPLGSMKIVYGRGSGGHRGIESIIRSIKTKDFIRLKIGVLPTTPTGKPKKPKGEEKVRNLIMGAFGKKESATFNRVVKRAVSTLALVVREGRERAMNEANRQV